MYKLVKGSTPIVVGTTLSLRPVRDLALTSGTTLWILGEKAPLQKTDKQKTEEGVIIAKMVPHRPTHLPWVL